MFDQFKEKIHSVQLDLNAGLKSLSEKAREVGRSKKLPGDFHVLDSKTADLSALKPECVDAGDEILNRFKQVWTQLHINIEFSAEKAVKSDKVILELVEQHDKQLQGWKQLETRLQEVPVMVTQIQTLAVTLGKLEANFEEIESMLKSLEDTCEEEELLGNKKIQVAELVKYKELKSKERWQRRERLLDEYNQKFRRVEDKEDAKKKERQKAFQDVFAADMAHYRTHGKMSALVTQSSQELEDRLDDFELAIGRDDQQALDDFLGPDDDDEEDDDDDSSDSQSSARKEVTKEEHMEKDASDEEEDDEDNNDGEENDSRDKTPEESASAHEVEMIEDGQSGEEEKQKEGTGGSDSLRTQDTAAKDQVNSSQDPTLDQDHIEESGKDSLETSRSKQQFQEDQATKDGESIKEEDDDEEDDDDDDDDFGTPDEDGDESSTKP